jgi:hypothetical protein
MNASELFKAGKLSDAIAAQAQEVKSHPADHGRRLFLFALLAFSGDLARARKQIDAIHYDEMERESARLAYRQLLDAEEARRRVFRDGIMPQFLIPPPEYLYKRLEGEGEVKSRARAVIGLQPASLSVPPSEALIKNAVPSWPSLALVRVKGDDPLQHRGWPGRLLYPVRRHDNLNRKDSSWLLRLKSTSG